MDIQYQLPVKPAVEAGVGGVPDRRRGAVVPIYIYLNIYIQKICILHIAQTELFICRSYKTGLPNWRYQTGSPYWRYKTGLPNWRYQTGLPNWKYQTGSPNWRYKTGLYRIAELTFDRKKRV